MWKFPLWLWSSVWTAMDLWVPHISVETFLLQKRQWCKIPQESSGILRNFAQYVKLSTRLTPNVGPVRLLNHLQKQLNVMYVLVWVVRPLWYSVGLCARPVAWLQLLVEPVEKLQIHEYLCSFSPYRGVFSLCFCIPLADCIVLPNKYYYIWGSLNVFLIDIDFNLHSLFVRFSFRWPSASLCIQTSSGMIWRPARTKKTLRYH